MLKAVTGKEWTSEEIARICEGDLGPLLKDKPELGRDLAAAERRLKEAKAKLDKEARAKLDALGVNEKGERKSGPPKSPGETPGELSVLDKTAIEAAVKEYQEAAGAVREAEGAIRGFKDAFEKLETPELKELRLIAAGEVPLRPYYDHSSCYDIIALERRMCKIRTGNRILSGRPGWKIVDWVLEDDPADDPGLPRIDESGKKAGTAKTVDLGDSVKLELVWIPAGEVMMGSRKGDVGRLVIEKRHRVKLTKGFWMGKYEVTQEQWEKVMGYNPSWFTNAGPRAPVECVNWFDCQRFTTKLNRSATVGAGNFRLPTEAEWEWACRAGTDKPLYTGQMTIKGANNSPELDAIAWYAGNSGVEYAGGYDSSKWPDKQCEHRLAGTHPVGGKKPNAWGLYDMLGNVREWCEDKFSPWDPNSFNSRPVTDPFTKEGDLYIQRGGCWSDLARLCRSPSRHTDLCGRRGWTRNGGFRVVMDEPATAEKK